MSTGSTTILRRLGAVIGRRPWAVVAFWILVAGALNVAIPQLEQIVASKSSPFLATHSESTDTLRAMAHDFGVPESSSLGSVVITTESGVTPAVEAYYRDLVTKLIANKADVAYVLDIFSAPGLREVAVSPDGKAINLVVAGTGDVGSSLAHHNTNAVRDIIAATPAPAGVVVHVTGASPTLADVFHGIDVSLLIITGVSVALITLLLLLVYRSVFTALVPLLTIGIALGVARPIIGFFGLHDVLPISNFTIAIGTALILGAGTDYAIFIIASYHEARRRGVRPDEAVLYAMDKIGHIIVASALTICAATAAMAFTQIGMFKTAGPPAAVGIAITALVSLTLPPALITILARRGFLEPRPLNERRWRRTGARVVRHALPLTALSLAILAALAAILPTYIVSFDENRMQLRDTDSKQGYRAVYAHWGVNEVAPEYVVIRSDHDMRNTNDLAALELAAIAVQNLPQVAYVRSVTRPDGKPLPESAIGYQTQQVADGLGGAAKQIEQATPQLKALAAGVTALRDGAVGAQQQLPELVSGTTQLTTMARALLGTYESVEATVAAATDGQVSPAQAISQLGQVTTLIEGLLPTIRAIATQINGVTSQVSDVFGPLAAAAPPANCGPGTSCAQARAAWQLLNQATNGRAAAAVQSVELLAALPDIAVRRLTATLPNLQATIANLNVLLGTIGNRSPQQLRADLDRLTAGLAQLTSGMDLLANGLGQVKTGTDQVVTLTGKLREGLDSATSYLATLSKSTTTGAGTGFYLPDFALKDPRFQAGTQLLLSPDGRVARMLAVWQINPYSAEAMDAVPAVRAAARNALQGTILADADVSSTGLTSLSGDTRTQVFKDFALFGSVAVIAVLAILMLLLRSVVAPIVLVATVLLSFAAAAGLSVLIWQHILGIGLDWATLPVAFMALVAVGADYSMLFADRIREETVQHGPINGIIRSFGSTGSVITTAGIVFAITMFALMSGSVINLLQIGSTIALGLILDITVVRTVLVPATIAMMGERIWWPRKIQRARTGVRSPNR